MKKTVILSLTFLISANVLKSESINLKPEIPYGKKLIIRMTMNQNSVSKMPQMPQPQQNNSNQSRRGLWLFERKIYDSSIRHSDSRSDDCSAIVSSAFLV